MLTYLRWKKIQTFEFPSYFAIWVLFLHSNKRKKNWPNMLEARFANKQTKNTSPAQEQKARVAISGNSSLPPRYSLSPREKSYPIDANH
jgi:hypothetical protein